MAGEIFASTTVPLLEQVIGFTQARHGVLAGNIANLDTPGYKSRDLSPEMFQENLKRAVESRNAPVSPGSQSATTELDAMRKVKESFKSIERHDGGDVSLEQQIAEISKNHSQHNLAVALMTNQFSLMRAAISERNI